MRSNLNFEVIWWVKKSKTHKIAEKCKIVFLAVLAEVLVTTG